MVAPPLPPGSHELTLSFAAPGGATIVSSQSIAVSVPAFDRWRGDRRAGRARQADAAPGQAEHGGRRSCRAVGRRPRTGACHGHACPASGPRSCSALSKPRTAASSSPPASLRPAPPSGSISMRASSRRRRPRRRAAGPSPSAGGYRPAPTGFASTMSSPQGARCCLAPRWPSISRPSWPPRRLRPSPRPLARLRGPAAARQIASTSPAAPPSSDVTVAEIRSTLVTRGDSLWRISKRVYGKGLRFTVIYEANQQQIRDPRRIYPGQVFVLPDRKADVGRFGRKHVPPRLQALGPALLPTPSPAPLPAPSRPAPASRAVLSCAQGVHGAAARTI